MEKEESYVLYVLRIPKVKAIKVGITSLDRYLTRFKEIEKAFGAIDKNKSMYFKSNSYKDIKNLEKALHLLFWKRKKELKTKGSGHTEFFYESSLESIIFIIKELKKKEYKNLKGEFRLNGLKKRLNIFYLTLIFTSAIAALIKIEFLLKGLKDITNF